MIIPALEFAAGTADCGASGGTTARGSKGQERAHAGDRKKG